MSLAERLARTPTGRWSVWKYNWLSHRLIVGALERARPHAQGALLDVGCGSKPFAGCLAGRIDRHWGVDLPSSPYLGADRPDAYARAEALPLRDRSIDTLLCLSVLTYLPEPRRLLEEAHRVLRPGGTALIEFTQMAPLHDEPHDYFRFTRYGAARLLEGVGFEPLELIPIGGLWARVGLSMIAGLNRLNRGPTRVLTELPVRAAYVLLQLGFGLLDRLFSDRREVLAHLAVARKIAPPRPGGD